MYIRTQGKQVQCVRSPYDPAKKKCVQKVIVTFPISYFGYKDTAATQLPADKLALLTSEEVAQLDAWLSKQAAERQNTRDSFDSDPRRLAQMADAMGRVAIDASKAAELWAGIEAISKALKKAGFPHSDFKAVKAPKAAKPLPGQQDLLAPAGGNGASAS